MKRLGKTTQTTRGFGLVKFTDAYDKPCSVQESSLCSPHLWLGTDNPQPMVLHSDAHKLGIKTAATCGWVPYLLPAEVSIYTRMHLSRKQVKQLIRHLSDWLKKGQL